MPNREPEITSPLTGSLESGTLTADTWITVTSASLIDLTSGNAFAAGKSITGLINHLDGPIYWRAYNGANDIAKSGRIAAGAARNFRGKSNGAGENFLTIYLRRPAATTDGAIEFEVEQ